MAIARINIATEETIKIFKAQTDAKTNRKILRAAGDSSMGCRVDVPPQSAPANHFEPSLEIDADVRFVKNAPCPGMDHSQEDLHA